MPETLSVLDRLDKEREENLRLQVANYLDHDPELATRILDVKGKTGLPDEVIASDIDNIERQVRQRQFNPETYRKESPKWTEFASENPFHLAVLKDDYESLRWWERMWKPISLGYQSGEAMVERSHLIDRRRDNNGEWMEGDEEKFNELEKWEQPHHFGQEFTGIEGYISAAPAWLSKQIPNMIYSTTVGAEYATYSSVAGAGAGAYIGSVFPGLGTAAGAISGYGIGRAYGFGVGIYKGTSHLEGSNAYQEYRELGISHENALIASHVAGSINGVAEAIGIGVILRRVPGVGRITTATINKLVIDVVKKPTVQRAVAAGIQNWGIGLGSEMATEIIQEATTITAGEILKEIENVGERLTMEEIKDRISDIAVETFKSTLLLAGMGPGAQLYIDRRRATNAKQREYAMRALSDGTKDSKLRAKLKPKYLEYVEKVTKDGPIESVQVSKAAIDEYFQEIDDTPGAMLTTLGLDDKAIAHAEVTGWYEIAPAALADHIVGTEHNSVVARHMRTNENQMTAAEAEHYFANEGAIIKTLEGDLKELSKEDVSAQNEILNDVMGQLMGQNTERTAASKQALVIAESFVNLAERNNMKPIDFFREFFGGVKGAVPDVLGKPKDIDIAVDPLLDAIRAGEKPSDNDIFGQSLISFIKSLGGIQDQGGELSARDVWRGAPFLQREGGRTLDEATELAFEAGYIVDYDQALFMDALDAELRGERVLGSGADPLMADRARAIEELDDYLQQNDIDINLSNAEIRKLLEPPGETFNQIDTSELEALTEYIFNLTAKGANTGLNYGGTDPMMLARAAAVSKSIAAEQDFGKAEYTDTMLLEGVEPVEVTRSLQKEFDKAVNKRTTIKKLLDCVSG